MLDLDLDDSLDALVGSVAHVRESPAGVSKDLIIRGVNETSEGGEGLGDELPRGLGLATAEVGEGPGGVAVHGDAA